MEQQKEIVYVSGQEKDSVDSALLTWMNEFDALPKRVKKIGSDYMASGENLSLFSIESPYKTKDYIDGSYNAQYQFVLQYKKAAKDETARLYAKELLTNIAAWAERRDVLPDLGRKKQAISVERVSASAIPIEGQESGYMIYQILMVMTYQVFP